MCDDDSEFVMASLSKHRFIIQGRLSLMKLNKYTQYLVSIYEFCLQVCSSLHYDDSKISNNKNLNVNETFHLKL